MRRTLDTFVWVIVITIVAGAFYVTSMPGDLEAFATTPMCHKPGQANGCRLCGGMSQRLPYILDERSLRAYIPPTAVSVASEAR
jgi:hypothetical protein